MHTIQGIDYVVLSLYMALLAGVGIFYAGHMKELADYFAGGREIPWWVAGLSMYMSSFSASAFVAYAGVAYQHGLEAATLLWLVAPACILGAFLFAHLWRRVGIVSPVEFLEARYSPVVRQSIVWTNLLPFLIEDGVRIYATGIFLHDAMGLSLSFSIVLVSLVMLFYTFLGGVWAVSVADVIQFAVLSSALLILFPLSLRAVGGFSSLVQHSPPGFFHLTNSVTPFYLITFFLLFFVSYNTRWSLVQRFYCVRTEKDARKLGLLTGSFYIFGTLLWILPVIASRQILPHLANPDFAFAALAIKILPPGVMGLLLAAILSATMGSVAAEYNVIVSVLTQDLYLRYLNRQATAQQAMKVGKFLTIAVGLFTMGIALLINYSQTSVFNLMIKVLAVSLGATGIPVLMGLVYRKATTGSAIAAILSGISTVGLFELLLRPMIFAQWAAKPFWAISTFFYILVPFLVILVWPYLRPPGDEEAKRIAAFYECLDRPSERPKKVTSGMPSPMFIIGINVCAIGCILFLVVPFIKASYDFWLCSIIAALLVAVGLAMYLRSRMLIRMIKSGQ